MCKKRKITIPGMAPGMAPILTLAIAVVALVMAAATLSGCPDGGSPNRKVDMIVSQDLHTYYRVHTSLAHLSAIATAYKQYESAAYGTVVVVQKDLPAALHAGDLDYITLPPPDSGQG